MPCDCGKPAGPVCNTKATQNKGHAKVATSRTTETLRGFWPGPHSMPFHGRRFEFSLCVRVTAVRIHSFPCVYIPSTIRITHKKLKNLIPSYLHFFNKHSLMLTIQRPHTQPWDKRKTLPQPARRTLHTPSCSSKKPVRLAEIEILS